MLKVKTYSVKGTKLTDIALPKSLEASENPALFAQAIYVYNNRAHVGLADTKTRSEINRTKKKMYKQKGTGGARHGARSAPIFVGGGVAHGPKPIRRRLILPQKMKQKALAVAMSLAVKEDKVLAVGGLSDVKKTVDLKGLMKNLKTGSRILVALTPENMSAARALRNIKGVIVKKVGDLNAYDVFFARNLVLDKDAFEVKKAVKAKTTRKATKK